MSVIFKYDSWAGPKKFIKFMSTMQCVSTSEEPETIENGEQEVSGMPCSQTDLDDNSMINHQITATSEVASKDDQDEKEDDGDTKKDQEQDNIAHEEEKATAPTKMESELEGWSKSLDDSLEAAGD